MCSCCGLNGIYGAAPIELTLFKADRAWPRDLHKLPTGIILSVMNSPHKTPPLSLNTLTISPWLMPLCRLCQDCIRQVSYRYPSIPVFCGPDSKWNQVTSSRLHTPLDGWKSPAEGLLNLPSHWKAFHRGNHSSSIQRGTGAFPCHRGKCSASLCEISQSYR